MTDLTLHHVYVHDRYIQLWDMPRYIQLIVRNVGKIAKETNGKCYVDYYDNVLEVKCSDGIKVEKDVFSIVGELGITPKLIPTTDYVYEVDGEPIEDYLMKLLEKARKEEEERKKREELRERIASELGISTYDVELDDSLDYMKSLTKTFKSLMKMKDDKINAVKRELASEIERLKERIKELEEVEEKYTFNSFLIDTRFS